MQEPSKRVISALAPFVFYEYIAGKSFLFISLKEKFDLAFTDLSILFLKQSLIFSTIACNATPTPLAKRSRVTYGK